MATAGTRSHQNLIHRKEHYLMPTDTQPIRLAAAQTSTPPATAPRPDVAPLETFGHEPMDVYTNGKLRVVWCYRCHITWPCTSAVVLGLAKRHDPPVEEREITPDNVGELYGWCEPSKLRHAVGSSGRLEVVGLTVWVGGVRTPALFGDTIVRDGSEFTVRPAAEVTR